MEDQEPLYGPLPDKQYSTFLHGVFMWLAWAIFGMVMFATNRWFAYKSNNKNQLVHTIMGLTLFALALTGMVLMWISMGEIEFSWRGLHRIGGWLVILSILPAVVGGLVTQYYKQNKKWNT